MWWARLLNNIAGILGTVSPILGDYESIQTHTVGSGGQASVTFTTIPSTYKHLQIRLIAQTNRAVFVDSLQLNFNSDTGSNYSWHGLQGDGSSPSAFGYATQTYARIGDGTIGGATGSGGQFGAGVIDILDYASANKNKTIRGLIGVDENGAGRIALGSGLWQNSSTAISSISIAPQAGTLFLQYSSFALYGIKG
jgi:hypothetical protein